MKLKPVVHRRMSLGAEIELRLDLLCNYRLSSRSNQGGTLNQHCHCLTAQNCIPKSSNKTSVDFSLPLGRTHRHEPAFKAIPRFAFFKGRRELMCIIVVDLNKGSAVTRKLAPLLRRRGEHVRRRRTQNVDRRRSIPPPSAFQFSSCLASLFPFSFKSIPSFFPNKRHRTRISRFLL